MLFFFVGWMRWASASSSSVPSMDIRWVRRRRDDLATNFAAARSIREVGRDRNADCPAPLAQWPVLPALAIGKRVGANLQHPGPDNALPKFRVLSGCCPYYILICFITDGESCRARR